jgi:hypothetical protein
MSYFLAEPGMVCNRWHQPVSPRSAVKLPRERHSEFAQRTGISTGLRKPGCLILVDVHNLKLGSQPWCHFYSQYVFGTVQERIVYVVVVVLTVRRESVLEHTRLTHPEAGRLAYVSLLGAFMYRYLTYRA